jgi:predicted O-methyltransferase YrrM
MLDIQNIRNSSLAKVWRWSHSPTTIPIVLKAPAALSNIDALRALFPQITAGAAEACRLELLRNHNFFEQVNDNLIEKRYRRTNCDGWNEFVYMAVRFVKPAIVFETGVFDGISSAVILEALRWNGRGVLVSIDLPAVKPILGSTHCMNDKTLPPETLPGWVIPDYLKERHRLLLGDSRELLPQLFRDYSKIDIFFHDSLHTADHQYFEYASAWPRLAPGGLLLSDDIFWSSAFHRFCKEVGRPYVNLGGFGAVRK